MALNSSGKISLSSNVAGESIALELGRAAGSTLSLGEATVRTLAVVSSGPIRAGLDFRGKSSYSFVNGGSSKGKVWTDWNYPPTGSHQITFFRVTADGWIYFAGNGIPYPSGTGYFNDTSEFVFGPGPDNRIVPDDNSPRQYGPAGTIVPTGTTVRMTGTVGFIRQSLNIFGSGISSNSSFDTGQVPLNTNRDIYVVSDTSNRTNASITNATVTITLPNGASWSLTIEQISCFAGMPVMA